MADRGVDTKVAYQHVSADEPISKATFDGLDDSKRGVSQGRRAERTWIHTILLQSLALLWLVPIAVLLWFNFSGWMIGASAWCPKGKCYRSLFSQDAGERAARFDKNDHNVVGSLQLVAKALEAWFVFVAASLLYIVTMSIASQKEGLPIGYLTKPMGSATTVTLTSWLPWANGAMTSDKKNADGTRYQQKLLGLVVLSIVLFVLCSLMGPATAVLVIPSLQWIQTEKYGQRQLQHVNSDLPPLNDTNSWFFRWTKDYCSVEEYASGQFLCTLTPFGRSLDALAQGWISSNGRVPGLAPQDDLSFRLNATYAGSADTPKRPEEGTVWWAPSRQIVSNLSTDYQNLRYISGGDSKANVEAMNQQYELLPDPYETYTDYNRSLELDIRRNGPVIGAISNMWVDYDDMPNYSGTYIDIYRGVRCYANYDLYWTPGARGSSSGNFTKCIRTGGGWDERHNQWRQFTIDGRLDPETRNIGPNTTVQIISSDKAVFLPNGEFPPTFNTDCLVTGWVPNNTICDWDALFTVAEDDPMYSRTKNMVTLEYLMREGNSSVRFAVDFAAYLAYTEYSFNPSITENPMRIVQVDTLPATVTNDTQPIFVDPTWVLAGWSADNNSIVYNRPMTLNLAIVMETLLDNKEQGMNVYAGDAWLDVVAGMPIMHSLSLIDHSTVQVSEEAARKINDEWHPSLQRYARMFVWSYGMTSRTSIMGAVVAIMGCCVAIAQAVLGLLDRRPHRSPTQLLVAALEHVPQGEFDGKGRKEKELAAARFRVRDDENRAGKFSFYEPQH